MFLDVFGSFRKFDEAGLGSNPQETRHVCFKEIKEVMSSKKKRSEGRSGESVEKAEEIFQAVILSDSFNLRFLPISLETPRVRFY